ncbi:MAG TPA: acetyl-CoA hydrolase/transferase C-terminal domain-containing protein [Flavobacterium sp.]|nr:acetyl-CoA hydrolase/transferase C-terminal domain-containing protein [Flavobacterium sp.]
MSIYISAQDAVKLVKSGDRVFLHGSAATPLHLINALLKRAGEVNNVELVSISTFGNIDWKHPQVLDSFYLNSLFVSANIREWANSSHGGYIPIFLSEIPRLFSNGSLPLDVAIVHVSPPDRHGYCSLGTSIDAAWTAVREAKTVIAQVNPKMARTHGDSSIHFTKFKAMVWHETDLLSVDYNSQDEVSLQIGRNVAELIEDGSTLQAGIGTIPNAVLNNLGGHKDLGVHTEMFSDGLVPLIQKGIVNNEKKKVYAGKTVTAFVAGTQDLYDFIDDNPTVSFMNVAHVNDTAVIRKNPKVVAINSALEIDLTGQICADSIGAYQYSGIGGQMDFMRGASLSEGGKAIIAMPSVTGKGVSKITPFLKQGAGVVTTRGHVHYVVTEYGVVNLYGKNTEQRSKLLINIAHPEHREALEKAHFERFK